VVVVVVVVVVVAERGGGRRGNFLFLFNLENLNFDFSYIFFNV